MRRFGVFIITVLFAASMLHAQSIDPSASGPSPASSENGPSIAGSVYGGGRRAPVNGNAKIQMKGGEVVNSIFGGNDISGSTGNTGTEETDYGVIVTGGSVGNVYGGANGFYGCHGEENSNSIFYTSKFDSNNEDVNLETTTIPYISKTFVRINGGTITGSVYGGGNLAPVGYSEITSGSGSVKVTIQSGTIGSNVGNEGNVFAGGNMASVYVPSDLVVNNEISTGSYATLKIHGGVYGGNDKSGTIVATRSSFKASDGNTDVPANATYVKIEGTPTIGFVFGAGNGKYNYDSDGKYIPAGSSEGLCNLLPPHQTSSAFVDINTKGGYIGTVCGGGNLANVDNATTSASTVVLLNTTGAGTGSEGENVGKIYGAGYGDKGHLDLAKVTGSTQVLIKSGTVSDVYGGGCMASVNGYTDVYVQGGSVGNVYGGNDITGTVELPTTPAFPVSRINSDNDAVTSASYVKVTGSPTIGQVYGGGNGKYDYISTYAGLNPPVIASTFVDLNMAGGEVTTAFAGGNNATVTENASVLLNTNGTINTENPLVGSIFGGNNVAAMNILPNINLERGVVENVYGGGNMGAMTGSETKTSLNGSSVQASTYVLVNSDYVYVTNNLYGGCNQATVAAATYVDMRKGYVNNLYGGNDIGAVVNNTRIDVSGGQIQNIFGGSNGFYEYTATGSGVYNVKEFGGSEDIAEGVALPVCTTTNVNIWGGTFGTEEKTCNIYAGGKAGDCGDTYLNINDQTKVPANLLDGI